MKQNKGDAAQQQQNIQCVEVLILKDFLSRNAKLCHTLSLYSLQNGPVQNNPLINHTEMYHFMVYDWKRTIKALLEQLRIPYTILVYFSPKTIHSDEPQRNYHQLNNDLCGRKKVEMESEKISNFQADLIPDK